MVVWVVGPHIHSVMAGLVPAIPMMRGAALHTIGITGTSPVMTSEGASAGDDRAGTVMTRWDRTLSWVAHSFIPHLPLSDTHLRPAPAFVTPSAVMAGLDPAIPTREARRFSMSGSPAQGR